MSKKEISGEQIRDILMNGSTSLIPGGTYLKGILNFRQDLKQNRAIHFLESFINGLSEIKGKSNEEILETCKTEDFIDVFDAVIDKVQQTKSEQKAKRFSDLLLKQIIDPLPDYFMIKIIEILHRLNDVQIHMLLKLNERRSSRSKFSPAFYYLFGESDNNERDIFHVSLTPDVIVKVYERELELYLKDLVSLGLVNHWMDTKLKSPRNNRPNEQASIVTYEDYRISKTGKAFLELLGT